MVATSDSAALAWFARMSVPDVNVHPLSLSGWEKPSSMRPAANVTLVRIIQIN